MAEARGFEAAPLGMRTPDGTPVVYPLVRFKRRVAQSLADAWSSWAGTYGGPIAERELSADEQGAAHLAMLQATKGNVRVLLTADSAEPPHALPCERVPDSTHLLTLGDDFDQVIRSFRQSHRRRYKRGIREGITVERRNGDDAVAHYLDMYEANLRRWGDSTTVRHPPDVFRRLDSVGREHPDVIRLTVAELDGTPLAAAWTLHWRGRGYVWAVASHDPPEGLSPINVLYGELFRAAVEEKTTVFDLHPSAGLKGVQDSKAFYGAEEHPVWHLRARRPAAGRVSTAVNVASRLRRRVTR